MRRWSRPPSLPRSCISKPTPPFAPKNAVPENTVVNEGAPKENISLRLLQMCEAALNRKMTTSTEAASMTDALALPRPIFCDMSTNTIDYLQEKKEPQPAIPVPEAKQPIGGPEVTKTGVSNQNPSSVTSLLTLFLQRKRLRAAWT